MFDLQEILGETDYIYINMTLYVVELLFLLTYMISFFIDPNWKKNRSYQMLGALIIGYFVTVFCDFSGFFFYLDVVGRIGLPNCKYAAWFFSLAVYLLDGLTGILVFLYIFSLVEVKKKLNRACKIAVYAGGVVYFILCSLPFLFNGGEFRISETGRYLLEGTMGIMITKLIFVIYTVSASGVLIYHRKSLSRLDFVILFSFNLIPSIEMFLLLNWDAVSYVGYTISMFLLIFLHSKSGLAILQMPRRSWQIPKIS